MAVEIGLIYLVASGVAPSAWYFALNFFRYADSLADCLALSDCRRRRAVGPISLRERQFWRFSGLSRRLQARRSGRFSGGGAAGGVGQGGGVGGVGQGGGVGGVGQGGGVGGVGQGGGVGGVGQGGGLSGKSSVMPCPDNLSSLAIVSGDSFPINVLPAWIFGVMFVMCFALVAAEQWEFGGRFNYRRD